MYAATRSLSQLTTSFFASQCQGIRHAPLFALNIVTQTIIIADNGFSFILFNCSIFIERVLCFFTTTIVYHRARGGHAITKIAFPICQRTSSFKIQIRKSKFQTFCSVYGLEPLLRCLIQLHLLFTLINSTPLCCSPFFPLREKSGGYRSRTDDPLRARQML